jgi:hypothetical protein
MRADSGRSDWKPSDSIPSVFDKNQRAGFEVGLALGQHCRETLVDRVRAFICESKDDDARLIENAKSENVAEVQIERHDDATVHARPFNELGIACALQPEIPDVSCRVTELLQELDCLGRDSGICQEAHASSAKRVQLVLCQGSGVDERLANVFLVKVR